MRWLTAGCGICLLLIAARVIQIQGVIAEDFFVPWEQTTTSFEPIPASNGRIVSADGVVLAYDRTRFDLSVHYRWLEEPADPRWLAQQARLRLPPRDRRNRTLLKQAEEEVLKDRAALWEALARQTGQSPESMAKQRSLIQARIERMAKRVIRLRDQKQAQELAKSERQRPAKIETLGQVWEIVASELTSTPERESSESLVIKEELLYHKVLTDLPLAVAAGIEASPATYPPEAVAIQQRTERVYPGKELASHVIGVRRTNRTASSQTADSPGGEGGIEQAYDVQLRGKSGLRKVVYNRRREVLETVVVRPPVDGQDVTLSILSGVQRAAEQILEKALTTLPETPSVEAGDDLQAPVLPRGGTIVAIDVTTGELIAAACAPRFDLNLFNEFDADRWKTLVDDPRRPFFPRITAMTAPPGSVFKVLTAVAALEEQFIDPDTPIHCQGYFNRPDQLRCMIFRQHGGHHGDVTMADAMCQSCNVYFFEAARRMGNAPLHRWSERFGFGVPTGADLPGEAGGRLPKWSAGPGRQGAADGSAMQLAIGQSSLLVSPLQVTRMMAAIANGGQLVSPRFAHVQPRKAEADSDVQLAGFEDELPGVSPVKLDLHPRTITVLRESLERVVSDPLGTGKTAAVAGVSVAGKTGTAETGGGQPDHAWFAGYVPADRPRVAFVVMLEHAGSASKTAGPVASEFVESLVAAGLIRRNGTGRGLPPVQQSKADLDSVSVTEPASVPDFTLDLKEEAVETKSASATTATLAD